MLSEEKAWDRNKLKQNLSKLNVLLAGQLLTGRMEVLEDYLREKVRTLLVVGTVNPRAENTARLYDHSKLALRFRIPIQPKLSLYKRPLLRACMLAPIYALNLLSILYSVLRLRKRFDIFIGVGFYSTFFGLILRRLGVVDRLIYYSIDFFTRPLKFGFDTFYIAIFQLGDKVCAKASNIVWHATSHIAEARKNFAGLHPDHYQHIVVPVGFRSDLLRHMPFKDIERLTMVFVGTYGKFHGLDLLLDAMPLIIEQIPNVKVRIIGSGPWDELKRLVAKLGLKDHFIFHGFMKEEEKLFDLVSRCAIGVAPYAFTADNPTIYADPGKPKLYAFCGVPIIITKTAPIAFEIHARKAGVAINYDKNELATVAIRLLQDDQFSMEYRDNATSFARSYTSERLFNLAFHDSLSIFSKDAHRHKRSSPKRDLT